MKQAADVVANVLPKLQTKQFLDAVKDVADGYQSQPQVQRTVPAPAQVPALAAAAPVAPETAPVLTQVPAPWEAAPVALGAVTPTDQVKAPGKAPAQPVADKQHDPISDQPCKKSQLSILSSVRLRTEDMLAIFYNDMYLRWIRISTLCGLIHVMLFFIFVHTVGQRNALSKRAYVKTMHTYFVYSYGILIAILLWQW